ncbi:Cytochrome P450 [Naviculisporaceae sp. PSN 640]
MAPALAIAVGGALTAYLLLRALLYVTQDKREPPMVEATIPFVSPILGMGSKKAAFYTSMHDKYQLPIYTLRMPGAKLYVVNSTALITVVQRHHRTIAFPPIAAQSARDAMACSDTATRIISLDPTKDEAYMMTFAKAMHLSLAPGPHLDAMNRISVQGIAELLDKLQEATPRKIKLFEWTRHSILRVTTDSVFGSRNLFRDPSIEQAWYTFEPSILIFMIGLVPSIFAREAIKAREKLVSALERYLASSAPNDPDTSELIRARLAHNNSFSIPLNDQARFELGNIFALLGNTLPSSFWLLYHIFSDPNILSEVRDEVSKIVSSTTSSNSRAPIHTIDAAKVMSSCPILLSTLREVFRYHGIGVSARVVLEDHLLDGKYLLKKGNTVMIPSRVQHFDASIWGPDVSRFNHRRFVKTDPGHRRSNPVAFRGFGGGTNLCPGRHFASTEILAFAALMVMRFDMRPSGGKKWVEPSVDKSPLHGVIPTPDTDIEVEVELRGPRERTWRVEFSGSEKAMELSAEDTAGAARDVGH